MIYDVCWLYCDYHSCCANQKCYRNGVNLFWLRLGFRRDGNSSRVASSDRLVRWGIFLQLVKFRLISVILWRTRWKSIGFTSKKKTVAATIPATFREWSRRSRKIGRRRIVPTSKRRVTLSLGGVIGTKITGNSMDWSTITLPWQRFSSPMNTGGRSSAKFRLEMRYICERLGGLTAGPIIPTSNPKEEPIWNKLPNMIRRVRHQNYYRKTLQKSIVSVCFKTLRHYDTNCRFLQHLVLSKNGKCGTKRWNMLVFSGFGFSLLDWCAICGITQGAIPFRGRFCIFVSYCQQTTYRNRLVFLLQKKKEIQL